MKFTGRAAAAFALALSLRSACPEDGTSSEAFEIPTCNYIDCLGTVLDSIGRETFGDAKLDRRSRIAHTRLAVAKEAMEEGGKGILGSLNTLMNVNARLQSIAYRAAMKNNLQAEESSTKQQKR